MSRGLRPMVECPLGKLAGFFMRFTIREILWLTAIVAFGAGWFTDARRRDLSIQAAQLRVENAEFRVERAQAETRTVKEMADIREKNLVFAFRLQLARISPDKRAEFEREYPNEAKLFFPNDASANDSNQDTAPVLD